MLCCGPVRPQQSMPANPRAAVGVGMAAAHRTVRDSLTDSSISASQAKRRDPLPARKSLRSMVATHLLSRRSDVSLSLHFKSVSLLKCSDGAEARGRLCRAP